MKRHPGNQGSGSDEWETPPELFEEWNASFQFTLDAAASDANHKVARFNSLQAPNRFPWIGERVWCNPPYSNISLFTHWAACGPHNGAVLLLPARTDSLWFHRDVLPWSHVHFLRKRVKFLKDGTPQKSPPFGSLIAVFLPQRGKR